MTIPVFMDLRPSKKTYCWHRVKWFFGVKKKSWWRVNWAQIQAATKATPIS